MKKIFLTFTVLLMFFLSKSQQYLTLQFATDKDVPQFKFDKSLKLFKFEGLDSISKFFNKYSVIEFEKKYPTVSKEIHPKTAELNRVFILKIKEDINSLFQDLVTFKAKEIVSFYLAFPSQQLVIPNDYGQSFTFYCGSTPNTGAVLDLINAQTAWDISQGSASIIIGVVDTGFDSTHEDLKNKVLPSSYFGVATPTNYHGTSVAGIAACETNNGKGFASIGNKTSLKFFDWTYSGILLAAQNGCKVINCSFRGSCAYNQDEQNLINLVYNNYKAVIVAASGNGIEGTHCPYPSGQTDDGNSYIYPASYEHVISVTSVCHLFDKNTFNLGCLSIPVCASTSNLGYNWKDYHDKFSNARSVCNNPTTLNSSLVTHNDKVDLAAPGIEVPYLKINNGYGNLGSGTSFSSPLVAGSAALILSVNPSLTPDDVEAILRCSSRDVYEILENTYYLNQLGSGRLDAGKALQLTQTWIPGSAPAQQAPPTDIRWFEILSNGIYTIEVESSCAANANIGYCNIGYRLQVVAYNPNQIFKWLTFYSENNAASVSNIRYGNSIYLSRGVDYPFINNNIGSLKACVRVNECIPSIYYAEDRASNCLGNGCTYNCPADITITGNYTTPLKESYTWVKSIGQTNISPTTSVKLDGSPTQGYVEFKPLNGSDYLLAAPTSTGEFIVQAYNGCDAGAPSRTPTNDINQIAIEGQIASDKITVYPNPNNGLFYVKCNNNTSNIEIYNTQGLLILEKKIVNIKKGSQIVTIDLSNFSSGIYIIKSNGENFIYKIVKI